MRRFLWVLGATLILALLPLTGHVAFAAERPQTAVTGASATTDNLAEATTDPAVAVRSGHADRHDEGGSSETDASSIAGDDTGDEQASRHAADAAGTVASGDEHPARHQQDQGDTSDQAGPPPAASDQGNLGNDPVAAPVSDSGNGPVAQPEPNVGTDPEQVTEAAGPVATGTDGGPSEPEPVMPTSSAASEQTAAPAAQRHDGASTVAPSTADNGAAATTSGTTVSAPIDRPNVAAMDTTDPGVTDGGNLDTAPSLPSLTLLPPVQPDLDRLIARLTVQGLCVPSGSELGDLSCGGGAIQLCLRATTTGLSLSCANPGGGPAPGGADKPGTSNPPPVTRPSSSQPGSNQPGGSRPSGLPGPGSGIQPIASGSAAGTSDPGPSTGGDAEVASISQPVAASERGDAVVLGRQISFAPAGTGLSLPTANVAALPSAPVSSVGPRVAGLHASRNATGLAALIPTGKAFSTAFTPKLSILSLVDHTPRQPRLPVLVVPRLPMLDPFAGLPAVTIRAGAEQPVSHASTGSAELVAAAPATGVRAAVAPAQQPVQQPATLHGRSPSLPTRAWTGSLPNVDVPSPVTPLRLLLVLLASGCFVAAAMTKWKGHRPRPRAAPAAKRPSRLI